jgi:glycosyltransferase involved in cell wall biosynthesis
MSEFQVSLILPVYNGERYLAEAIESALAQSFPLLEIIVVDDGSTDGSARLVQSYSQVRLLLQPQTGVSAARNRGVDAAAGNVLAFLDADDVWLPHKLELQAAALREDPALDMVFGLVDEFTSPELTQSQVAPRRARLGAAGLIPSTLVIRKSAFFRAGYFEPHWQVGEFFDWYARAQEQGLREYILPDVIVKRRLHGDNLNLRLKTQQGKYVQIAKELLERRRAAAKGMQR